MSEIPKLKQALALLTQQKLALWKRARSVRAMHTRYKVYALHHVTELEAELARRTAWFNEYAAKEAARIAELESLKEAADRDAHFAEVSLKAAKTRITELEAALIACSQCAQWDLDWRIEAEQLTRRLDESIDAAVDRLRKGGDMAAGNALEILLRAAKTGGGA